MNSGLYLLIILAAQGTLLILKLWEKVDWPWWVILLPLWLPLAFVGVGIVIVWAVVKTFGKGKKK